MSKSDGASGVWKGWKGPTKPHGSKGPWKVNEYSFRMQEILAKRQKFLEHIRATGNTRKAANYAGYKDSSYFHRLKRTDKEFAAEWTAAIETFFSDVYEPEMIRRSIEGVEKDVYFKGEVVGTEMVHSDGLTMFVAKALNPGTYGDKQSVTGRVEHAHMGIALLPITAPQLEDWERSAIDVHNKQKIMVPEETVIEAEYSEVATKISRG